MKVHRSPFLRVARGLRTLARALILLLALLFMLAPVSYPFLESRLGKEALLPDRPLQEMRALAPLPTAWSGRWFDVEKNWAAFDRWFSDHLGLRTYMVRIKNEIDYQLFRSSRRVYFGANGQLYGRNMADNELPDTEAMLARPQDVEAVARGVERLAADLRAQGVTMILVPVMSKQYYTRDLLPFFAPRVPEQSRFLALYRRLRAGGQVAFVDTDAILRREWKTHKVFYDEDFHWTDISARAVAQDIVDSIAAHEGLEKAWRHPLRVEVTPFTGSETRFASRLLAEETRPEPQLVKTWTERHRVTTRDAERTGIEFDTGTLDDPGLLPATCMYGNSFSDGFLRAGLPEHFASFTKFNRASPVPDAARLAPGRCRYLIVQLLDSQGYVWRPFQQLGAAAR